MPKGRSCLMRPLQFFQNSHYRRSIWGSHIPIVTIGFFFNINHITLWQRFRFVD